MLLFVVVLLKRTIYNKETKREAENERRENERSQVDIKRRLRRPILHQTQKIAFFLKKKKLKFLLLFFYVNLSFEPMIN